MSKSKEIKIIDEQTFLNELRLKALENLLRLIEKQDFRATKFVLENLDKSFVPPYAQLANAKTVTLTHTQTIETKTLIIDCLQIDI